MLSGSVQYRMSKEATLVVTTSFCIRSSRCFRLPTRFGSALPHQTPYHPPLGSPSRQIDKSEYHRAQDGQPKHISSTQRHRLLPPKRLSGLL